jgi:hypothetical protein
MPNPILDLLAGAVSRHATPAGAAWLSAQIAAAAQPLAPRSDLLTAFASAGRRLGKAPIALTDGEGALATDLAMLVSDRGADEVGRLALLLAAAEMANSTAQESLVKDLFLRGAEREKMAVLRALPLLPDPARFVAIGIEACRTSLQPVYEAIVCENPYPAEFFPAAAFHQMVLKALFIEVPVARIVGLERRVDDELVRMADDYGDERRAAGRTIPEDIDQLRELRRRKR